MKKGFTLIELLAVIVILAVIALIATPIILNIVEDSTKQAAIQGSKLYTDGLQTTIMSKNMLSEYNPDICLIENGILTCDAEVFEYNTNGNNPTDGYIKFQNGEINEYSLCLSGYKITSDGTNVTTVKDSECSIELPESRIEFNGTKEIVQNATHKGIVYLDPTNLSNECDSLNIVNVTSLEEKSGCMKFYIYDDSGYNYKMILDRNTSGSIAWNSSGSNSTGMVEVSERLLDDTEGWVGNPRLITADEIANIVGIDSNNNIKWNSSKIFEWYDSNIDIETKMSWFYLVSNGNSYDTLQTSIYDDENISPYAWLYDYLRRCDDAGCNVEDKTKYPYPTKTSETVDTLSGYWTGSAVNGTSGSAWYIARTGRLYIYDVENNSHNGVRPVITIPKNIID